MSAKRIHRLRARRESPQDWRRHYLLFGELTPDANPFSQFIEKPWRALWSDQRERLLADWIAHRPGTRPWAWWKYDAPEPRQRLGGRGTPTSDALNYVPHFFYGVPHWWLDEDMLAMHPGITAVPIDPDDPPTFESEAAYIRRLGLLLPEESRVLARHRAAFKPQSVIEILNPTHEEIDHD